MVVKKVESSKASFDKKLPPPEPSIFAKIRSVVNGFFHRTNSKQTSTLTQSQGLQQKTIKHISSQDRFASKTHAIFKPSLIQKIHSFIQFVFKSLAKMIGRVDASHQLTHADFKGLINPTGATSSCYIDMGILYGSYVMSNCMDWWPTVCIDQAKVDTFLNAMFAQMKTDGINKVELSFAQLCDIQNLLSGSSGSSSDTITQIFNPLYPVGATGENFLTYFNNMATQSGISVDLSFGGADSMLSDMTLSKVPPATQTQQLATFLQTYNFASVDFDIESPVIMQGNTPATVVSFFTQLHTLLQKAGKQSILTVEGGIAQGPGSGSPLSPLFTNFSTMFDGVNLMLYSTNQYYLDANNATWGIDQWLTYIKEPSLMHIGFYDTIDYTNPASSAGEQYAIPKGLTNGQAAAFIYLTMLSQTKYTVSEFGNPFFWTDNPTTISTNAFFTDFHNYIDANQPKFQKQ